MPFLFQIFEIGTTSALLRTLGPLEQKPKPFDHRHLLTTSLHSESEDSWTSSRERPRKPTQQAKKNSNTLDNQRKEHKTHSDQKQSKLEITPTKTSGDSPEGGDGSEGGYVNWSFRSEAEEQATPL